MYRMIHIYLLVLLVVFFHLSTLAGQTDSSFPPDTLPVIHVVRTAGGFSIDGYLTEDPWRQIIPLAPLSQREPAEGKSVSETTDILVCYDDQNLYFGIHCRDSEPVKIIANEMRRDQMLLDNDCIEIFLDTYHDHQSAFYFSTNPLGAQRDGIIQANVVDEAQNWDWNGVWENASRIDSTGWYAEIAIPFKTLRFKPVNDWAWGFNIARFIPRKREEAYWSPVLREYGFWGKYHLSTYGHLTGIHDVQHPLRWEIKPFILAGFQRDVTTTPSYDNKLEAGIDARYLVTPNLTATLTLHTDFAQVEADQEQINLTRFELFFPEKREFFLEGASIFNVSERLLNPFFMPSMLFFSRRIGLSEDNEPVPLVGGIKLTGKTGGLDVGLLNILANRTEYLNDDDEPVSIGRTNFTVLRLKKDIMNNSTLGIIGLNKQSLDDSSYNRNLGLDMNLFLTQNMQMSGFVARSLTPGLSGRDYAGYLDFFYINDLWNFFACQNSIQENFNSEMGYFPRTDIRRTDLYASISPRPGILDIRQIYFFNDFSYLSNQNGVLETRLNFSGFWSLWEKGTNLLFLFLQNYERLTEEFEIHEQVILPPGVYRFNYFYTELQTNKSKSLSGKLVWRTGGFYDGHLTNYGFTSIIKVGAHITLNIMVDYNQARLPAGDFETTLFGIRFVYSFTPRLFLKPFIQWNSDTREITSNVLFNFIHRPGSDLYVVYNELLDLSGEKVKSENRTVLVKFTYLFSL